MNRFKQIIVSMGLFSFLFGCGGNPYHKQNGEWYYDDRPINTLPGEKLVALNNRFARSGVAAYYRGAIIDSANGQHFEALSDHYAKDDQCVWYCDTYRKGQEYYFMKHNRIVRIDGVEVLSFTTLAEDYAKDYKAVYFEGVAFPVKDVSSFQVLGYGYTKDTQQVYYDRGMIKGADPATFMVLDPGTDSTDAKDKNRTYYKGKKR